MAKPILSGDSPIKATITLEWLVEVLKATDRESYACGGLFTCTDGQKVIVDLATQFLLMDEEELKKHCR